uniref:Uncharacterized protein n=1 Tax=Acrobeloides nanus TaxID=290746 RepID=A0A914CJ00_9BILA
MGIDMVVGGLDFMLMKINRHQILRRFTNNKITPANHLSRSYQLAENNRTIRIIFPISLAHSLIFICFLSSKILLQALEDDHGDKNYIIWDELCDTIINIYILIIALIYNRLRKLLLKPTTTNVIVKQADATEEYFKNLKTMFDENYDRKYSQRK